MPSSRRVSPRPPAGSQQLDREDQDQHQAQPEIRQREAEDRAGHDRRARASDRGASPAIMPSGMPSPTASTQRDEGQLERRRHAAEDQVDRRHAVHERAAEIAGERRLDEQPELHPERLVEAEPPDRALALDLVGVGADQDVDRIADRVDADEHQHRHHGDHQQALPEAAEQKGEHVALQPGRDGGESAMRPSPRYAIRYALTTRPARTLTSVAWVLWSSARRVARAPCGTPRWSSRNAAAGRRSRPWRRGSPPRAARARLASSTVASASLEQRVHLRDWNSGRDWSSPMPLSRFGVATSAFSGDDISPVSEPQPASQKPNSRLLRRGEELARGHRVDRHLDADARQHLRDRLGDLARR